MKIADFVLIAAVFLTGLAGVAAFSRGPQGSYVEIRTPYGQSRYSLGTDRTVDVRGKLGNVRFVIKDGAVACTESNCPERICVKKGAIRLVGDSIVCVPNGVSARITGGEDVLDGIAE